MKQLEVTIRCNDGGALVPTPAMMHRIIKYVEMQMNVRARTEVEVEYASSPVPSVRGHVELIDLGGNDEELG